MLRLASLTPEDVFVLLTLSRSVVFLTPEAVHTILRDEDLGTAWNIANVYLRSLGARELGRTTVDAVGLSENMVWLRLARVLPASAALRRLGRARGGPRLP